MEFDTHTIREWNKEHYNRLARSYADSQADAKMLQMWLAKALERFGALFATFSQHVDARSIRQQEQRMAPIPIRSKSQYVRRR